MWFTYSAHVIDGFNTWNAVGWLLLALMLFGVWRLWRGMRPDAFERGLRALREGRATVAFPRRRPAPVAARRGGWLQVSLLPLMLISCGAAMLLAQAQRPDDVSRPVTWAVFVAVATWYGTARWGHLRGVGPLRNFALAGVVSGVSISALLWGFYLAVDTWWGEVTYERMTTSFSSLLWWTAVGAAAGGLVGAVRAHWIYDGARGDGAGVERAAASPDELAVKSSPGTRKAAWGAVAMACCASLLFHLSAAPHLYRKVDFRYWVWRWDTYNYHPGDGVMLTMSAAPSARQPVPITIDVPGSNGPIAWGLAVPPGGAVVAPLKISESVAPRQATKAATPKRPIAAGEVITNDMLTVREYYELASFFVSDPNRIVGQVAMQPLAPDQPIRNTQVAPPEALTYGSTGYIDRDAILNVTSSLAPVRDGPLPVDVTEAFVPSADMTPDKDLAPQSTQEDSDNPLVDRIASQPEDLSEQIPLDGFVIEGAVEVTHALTPNLIEGEVSPGPSKTVVANVADPLTTTEPPRHKEQILGLGSVDALNPPGQKNSASGQKTTVVTTDGKSYSGLFMAKTDQAITLEVAGRPLVIRLETVQWVLTDSGQFSAKMSGPQEISKAQVKAQPTNANPGLVRIPSSPLPAPNTSSSAPPAPEPPAAEPAVQETPATLPRLLPVQPAESDTPVPSKTIDTRRIY